MGESILTSIKKLLGIVEDYEQFDQDIIIHINSAISVLTQLGVGPSDGFLIIDKTATWEDFIGEAKTLALVKSYVNLKVKLIFDPPQSSAAIDSMKELIDEFTFRIAVAAESLNKENNQNE